MKVFVLVDMEGITGVCLENHTTGGTPEYEQARRWMTQDVNACVQGALDAGATEITVLDGHGTNNFYNLIYEDLHEGAEYIEGTPHGWYITGLDSSYDCMLMLGMHAMAGTPQAVLEHTWSSARWVRCRVNGREMGEIGMMAAYAGHFGVPVTLVTGDRAACDEAKSFLGDQTALACVKWGLSRYSARMLPPMTARAEIRGRASEAVALAAEAKPFVIPGPVSVEVDYFRNSHVDEIKLGQGVEVIGPRTLRFSAADVPSAYYLMR